MPCLDLQIFRLDSWFGPWSTHSLDAWLRLFRYLAKTLNSELCFLDPWLSCLSLGLWIRPVVHQTSGLDPWLKSGLGLDLWFRPLAQCLS